MKLLVYVNYDVERVIECAQRFASTPLVGQFANQSANIAPVIHTRDCRTCRKSFTTFVSEYSLQKVRAALTSYYFFVSHPWDAQLPTRFIEFEIA